VRSSLLALGLAAASGLLGAGCGGRRPAEPVREQLAGHFRAALVDLGTMDASEDNGVDERRG
jgi:hypothetical protein